MGASFENTILHVSISVYFWLVLYENEIKIMCLAIK